MGQSVIAVTIVLIFILCSFDYELQMTIAELDSKTYSQYLIANHLFGKAAIYKKQNETIMIFSLNNGSRIVLTTGTNLQVRLYFKMKLYDVKFGHSNLNVVITPDSQRLRLSQICTDKISYDTAGETLGIKHETIIGAVNSALTVASITRGLGSVKWEYQLQNINDMKSNLYAIVI